MIKVTRFDGSELFVNADLIEFIEATPDTVLSLLNGKKILVKEQAEELIRRVVEYRRRILSGPEILNERDPQVSETAGKED